jgi:GNAT superfamily N-acetyltransferase
MPRLVELHTPEELSRWNDFGPLPALSPAEFIQHAADAHTLLIFSDGSIAGRCSLWWTKTPAVRGERVGIVGHYAARDAETDHILLEHACRHLAVLGCTLALGPMDGSTWRRYRLITDRGSEPPFFLEPDHPDEWVRHFEAVGFAPYTGYVSALVEDLAKEDPRLDVVRRRLTAAGVRIRPMDPGRAEEDLRRIYAVTSTSFQKSPLYVPLPEAEFLDLYRPLLPHVRPELVLLAEDGDGPIGFVFGIPDLLQRRRGVPMDTAIIKTLAVLPGRRAAGLGGLLVARCHEAARRLGLSRAIHALMHEGNVSRNICGERARPIRRYALFARNLRGFL